jgi:hypothetical protein
MNKSTLSESVICDRFIHSAKERWMWNGMGKIYRTCPQGTGHVVAGGRTARR